MQKKRRLSNNTNKKLSLNLQNTTCLYSYSVFLTACSSLSTLHPGPERRNTSPSHQHHPKEQGLAAVDPSTQKEGRSRSSTGNVREKTARRHGTSEGGGHAELQSPNSEVGEEGSREAKGRQRSRSRSRRSRRRRRRTQSLPRVSLRNNDESETEEETVRGRKRREGGSNRRPRKSRSVGSVRRRESKEEEQDEEDGVEREHEKREEMEEKEWSEDEVFLPVPSPAQKLPKPKHLHVWKVEEKDWEMAAGHREMRREEVQGETEEGVTRPVSSLDPESQKKPFSFLAATSVEQLPDAASDSDVSMSAASISGLSLAASLQAEGSRARRLTGAWLRPSQQKVAKLIREGRQVCGGAAAGLS